MWVDRKQRKVNEEFVKGVSNEINTLNEHNTIEEIWNMLNKEINWRAEETIGSKI